MDYNEILQPILLAVATGLAAMVAVLVKRLLKRAGIDIDEATERRIETVARKAVLAVEERAARRLKMELGKLSGADKNEEAIGIVLKEVPSAEIGAARSAVDAALPSMGMGQAAKASPGKA